MLWCLRAASRNCGSAKDSALPNPKVRFNALRSLIGATRRHQLNFSNPKLTVRVTHLPFEQRKADSVLLWPLSKLMDHAALVYPLVSAYAGTSTLPFVAGLLAGLNTRLRRVPLRFVILAEEAIRLHGASFKISSSLWG